MKPFLRALSMMRTSWPTTWSLLAFPDILAKTYDVCISRFLFFDDRHSANPFVTSKWCESISLHTHLRQRAECCLHIFRQFMECSSQNIYLFHATIHKYKISYSRLQATTPTHRTAASDGRYACRTNYSTPLSWAFQMTMTPAHRSSPPLVLVPGR